MIFDGVPDGTFDSALELGAGDGFQAPFIKRYAKELLSTDINEGYIHQRPIEGIRYAACDADHLSDSPISLQHRQAFDLIFSSNLLEHLRAPGQALIDMRDLLKDDGIMIHVMPNAFWKTTSLLLYHLHILSSAYEQLIHRLGLPHHPFRWQRVASTEFVNNPHQEKRGLWRRLLAPLPHGEYPSNWSELRAYRKRRWLREFDQSGWDIIAVRPGVVSSGYGFGWNTLRSLLRAWGISSEYAYIVCKRETPAAIKSKYVRLFDSERQNDRRETFETK